MPFTNSLVLNFDSPCNKYRVTFEDDGKVAYAYLKRANDIVGDVWLYNRCPIPETPEWKDRSNIPFANCKGYMSEAGRLTDLVTSDDVGVDWYLEGNGPVAYVYVFDDLYGVIGLHDKPGYARWAIKDGPLARVMRIQSKQE